MSFIRFYKQQKKQNFLLLNEPSDLKFLHFGQNYSKTFSWQFTIFCNKLARLCSPGTVFTTLNFLSNLRIGPIS